MRIGISIVSTYDENPIRVELAGATFPSVPLMQTVVFAFLIGPVLILF